MDNTYWNNYSWTEQGPLTYEQHSFYEWEWNFLIDAQEKANAEAARRA